MLAWERRNRNRQNVSLPPHPVQSGSSLLNGSMLPTFKVGLSHSDHWHTCNSSLKHPCRHSHDLPVHSIQSCWHPKPTFRGKRHTLGRTVLPFSLARKCCSTKGCAPVSKRTIGHTQSGGVLGHVPVDTISAGYWEIQNTGQIRSSPTSENSTCYHMGLRRP